jgi:hypothetical protein
MTRASARPAGRQSARQRQIAELLLDGPLDSRAIVERMGLIDNRSTLETLRLMRARGRVVSTHTSLRTCVLRWALTPRYEAQVRAYGVARRAPALCRVLRVLAGAPLPATADELSAALAMPESEVRSMLSAGLRAPALVQRAGTLARGQGRPSQCWRLTDVGAQALRDVAVIAARGVV